MDALFCVYLERDALFFFYLGFTMIGIIIGLVIMLADAFFIWCCCRVAGIADRAEEEWLKQEKEAQRHE